MSIIRFKDVEKLDKLGLKKLGAQHAQALLDEGFTDATVASVQTKKAMEYLNAFYRQLEYETRLQLTRDPEGWTDVFGATLSLSSTGDKADYESDPVYLKLKGMLKNRKDLLDLARKSDEPVYDSEKNMVPSVAIKTYSKETLIVKL